MRAVGLFAVALVGCAVWTHAGGASGGDRSESGPLAALGTGPAASLASAHVWVVQPGDTLWGIASALEPGQDVRPLVDRLNHELHGQPLQVGERIAIP